MISYNNLIKYLERKGLTVNSLKKEGVISDHSYRKIIEGEPVNLIHIDSICRYLDLPIEDVVEIVAQESDEHSQ